MLGIGQISTRIAELIRGALPYAIVNNNPDASLFARLASYSEVQQALDAGHKWITVKPSDVDYVQFKVSGDHVKIQSSWGARFTSTTTGAATVVCEVSGDYNWIEGIHTYVAGGATNGIDRRGIDADVGEYNYFIGCLVADSDASGICNGNNNESKWNTFIACHEKDADDFGFYMDSQGARMIGCTVENSGGAAFRIGGSGDNFLEVGNIALGANADFVMGSGADNGIMAANLLDGSTSDSGSGSEKGLNKGI